MSVRVAVSATEERTRGLVSSGPRRDFLELAGRMGAEIVFAPEAGGRRGWRVKLAGAHVRQAWKLARGCRRGETVFLDGEHIGIPYLIALWSVARRPAHVVMLGHLVTRPWKRALLAAVSRLPGPRVTLVLHSIEQRRGVGGWVSGRWTMPLVPYQVDTDFWRGDRAPRRERPLVLAVGSENRDYETLARAVDGLDVDVVIAAGSHWARQTAGAEALPANVTYLTEPLAFAALRELYEAAAMVVVPVHDVANQSGVTTILEAMSCARPVVTSASRGQRECVAGPLVRADGSMDYAATADRGPQLVGGPAPAHATGLYVLPGDAGALRAAIRALAEDSALAGRIGEAARRSVETTFGIDAYVGRLAALMEGPSAAPGPAARAAREAS